MTIDSSRSRFYANCTDGVVYAYDCVGVLSGQPAAKYSGHVNSTFYVKSLLSPDDQYLLSGSSDSNAYIWKVNSAPNHCQLMEYLKLSKTKAVCIAI